MHLIFGRCLIYFSVISCVLCIDLNVNDRSSILDATAILAHGVQELYHGNETGGVLGKFDFPPYYWWESGGAWGGMMQYWAYTKDESYSHVLSEALSSQLGPNYDFVREEEAKDTGNDDQAFWVFVAMAAAEYSFPPLPAPAPPWHVIVQNAWEDYVSRWNTTNCGGGLKWQFHPENNGFYYKNSISNGGFFQISARLARFTGNQTYVQWAEKIWDWTAAIGLISSTYDVYDGADELINCSAVDHHQWTYNIGCFLYGAATIANFTNDTQIWVERTTSLLSAADSFFTPYTNATDIMFEAACELESTCNTDQWSMKAYLSRWLGASAKLAPYISDRVSTLLKASAKGAASACTGGSYGNTCGSRWFIRGFDNVTGLGQQLSAFEVITALLAVDSPPPATLPGVTVEDPHSGQSPTPIPSTPNPTSTAQPLHDPPPIGVSRREAAKYGSPSLGNTHLALRRHHPSRFYALDETR